MEKEIVRNVRIGGKEPVDLEIGEFTWGDEEEVTEKAKEKKINPATGEKETSFNLIRLQRLKLVKSIKNREVTEEELKNTPRKDVLRIIRAYNKLNELGDAEKSSPSEDGLGGSSERADSKNPPETPVKA